MEDNEDYDEWSNKEWGYGLPYIPLSQLREMYQFAMRDSISGTKEESLRYWYATIRHEVDRLVIKELKNQIEKARNYIGIEEYPCPLCVYENGVFIRHCTPHQQLATSRAINYFLMKETGMEMYPGEKYTCLTQEEWEKSYLGEFYDLATRQPGKGMTDRDIRGLIKWQYDHGREEPSPMAEIIFKICCMVRDRIRNWKETDIILNLRERLALAEREKESAKDYVEKIKNEAIWYDRYLRIHKIHREDVRRRKEVRKFRLTNFSIQELEAELVRRQVEKVKKDDYDERRARNSLSPER